MTTTQTAPLHPDVLIVDDLPANLELLAEMLRPRGFKVRPVPGGALALQAAADLPPDLVLLDIDMPDMDGYEVCRRLKENEALREIPVIFISAMGETSDKVRGFEAGAVDYVTKPFQCEEVVSRLRTHLEISRLRRQLEHHNNVLEKAVAERTRELSEANTRLAALDQAKSDFLRLISHEVRTPLNGIFCATELLLLSCGDDPEAAEQAAVYQQSRRRLLTLLDDAMLLTRIHVEAAADVPPCPLRLLVEDALKRATPLAHARDVRFAAEPVGMAPVRGVPEHLTRALQSLLETAAKFARRGSQVRLRVSSGPAAPGLVIEADGQTVPEQALPRFFDLLAIEEPIVPGEDLGLALPLAERIVTCYGGTVTVENLTPPGIRLTVGFPEAPVSECT